MGVWSWFKKICTPYAFLRDRAHHDSGIAAGALIGDVVGGTSKGLVVGVAASVTEHDDKQATSVAGPNQRVDKSGTSAN